VNEDGRLSWPRWLGTCRDGLPVSRQSPIQVVTVPDVVLSTTPRRLTVRCGTIDRIHVMLFILDSSASHLLSVPRHNLSFGSRAFHFSAPQIWNSVPHHILQSQTLSSLRRHLKTDPLLSVSLSYPLATTSNAPWFSRRLWRYINHLLTYLLT